MATTLATATAFLYAGPSPVQTGVAPGTISPVRAAVLRGRVLDAGGAPLPGVTITILNHPEFGITHTRAAGMFDMAVNGGAQLTLTYAKDGYLVAQRQVQAPWQDFAMLPDVMIPRTCSKAINCSALRLGTRLCWSPASWHDAQCWA